MNHLPPFMHCMGFTCVERVITSASRLLVITFYPWGKEILNCKPRQNSMPSAYIWAGKDFNKQLPEDTENPDSPKAALREMGDYIRTETKTMVKTRGLVSNLNR